MRTVVAVLLLIASATAYKITFPTAGDKWYSGASTNKLTWERESTDPGQFTLVLSHRNDMIIPGNNVDLLATVPGSKGSIDVPVPYGDWAVGNWPVGEGFKLTFLSRTTSGETIYAQSADFEIVRGTPDSTSNSATNSASNGAMSVVSRASPVLAAGALLVASLA